MLQNLQNIESTPPLSAALMEALNGMKTAETILAKHIPKADALALLRQAFGMVAAMQAEAEQSERAGQLIVTLHQEEPITPKMLEAMKAIERGGLKKPIPGSRYFKGWNQACYRGFVGVGKDGYEKLTPIGRMKLYEAERQVAVEIERPRVLLLAPPANDLMRLYND